MYRTPHAQPLLLVSLAPHSARQSSLAVGISPVLRVLWTFRQYTCIDILQYDYCTNITYAHITYHHIASAFYLITSRAMLYRAVNDIT